MKLISKESVTNRHFYPVRVKENGLDSRLTDTVVLGLGSDCIPESLLFESLLTISCFCSGVQGLPAISTFLLSKSDLAF